MIPLVTHLRGHGDRPAVLTDHERLSYAELADRVEAFALTLGATRRLVLIETRNDVESLVHYLGALAGRHVALPVPAGRDHRELVSAYRPDVIIDGSGVHIHSRSEGGADHTLHDDLALLLSTSGSTGSPKLVRLSHTNLVANAASIADYLHIDRNDRAATTLPMSYCYGLSVLHSHLLVGAAIILTDLSVSDERFWSLFRHHRGTSFAGVPYTFELLDRVGFATMDLPHLRYLTQAGGKMSPELVTRYATLGERQGWRLFVMYGATEATARMAYLPPELARRRPTAIGVPVPGGRFEIEPLDDWPDGTGELVYRGRNVMLGYAEAPADLALGPTVDALRTGDIARRGEDGLYEVVGRRSRFVKMFGLRIDLARLENTLRVQGIEAMCTDRGERLAVIAVNDHSVEDIRHIAADAAGVPPGAVDAVAVAELPKLPSGKPDYPSARTLATPGGTRGNAHADLHAVFADVLGCDPGDIDDDASFVDLGGNSLSYVTMSVRLERVLGRLPTDWQRTTIRELRALDASASRRQRALGRTVETSVALRAAAIVAIVGSHAELFELWGGAHILLGVAGYNFGRFCLTPLPRALRIAHLRTTIAWIVVPSVLWIAFALAVTDDYHPTNLLLANKFLGPHDSMTAGRLWFVEVLVWALVVLALVFAMPGMDRIERRRPFGVAMAFLAVGLALRYDVLGLDLGREAWFTVLAFWFFAVGWAAAKASTNLQRAAVTAVLVVSLHGYFPSMLREALVLAGLTALIWLPGMRCPAVVAVVAGVLADASLYVYLTHYQVYPLFGEHRLAGVMASLVVGIALAGGISRVRHRLRGSPLRLRLPFGDQALLDQRGGDVSVAVDQFRGDEPPAAAGRG